LLHGERAITKTMYQHISTHERILYLPVYVIIDSVTQETLKI